MANSTTFKHVVGVDQLSAVLLGLPRDMREYILEHAVKSAIQPIVAAAKQYALRSERTGALRASISYKTINYKRSGAAVGMVGPARGYFRGARKLGKKDIRTGAESPSHYAHLVEFGHHIVTGGSSRAQYSLKLVGIGRYSDSGNELKRWKRDKIVGEAKGKAVGWVNAKPFMRPAVLTTTAQQSQRFADGLKSGFEASVRKQTKAGTFVA